MKFLFLFMDGVGLGADNPRVNPLARADLPNLDALLGGRKLTASSVPLESERASVVALDAVMGVDGMPQSATGQASLLPGLLWVSVVTLMLLFAGWVLYRIAMPHLISRMSA